MDIRLRRYWYKKIEQSWQHRSIIWLNGVRRSGKTFLAQSLPNIEYFDCELPRFRETIKDPEGFFSSFDKQNIVLDEIHRLNNPAEVLKIAADHYPNLKIIATGSSTLGASAKFKDTLVGRKTEIWLTPMIAQDLEDFGLDNLGRRLHHGGLPPFFLSKTIPEADFQEWMDAYWAKDIQELFRLERRQSFQRFAELLIMQSGGIFEATRFAGPCEVSRPTISNYLAVMEATYIAHVIRPFSARRSTEIVSAPKVYAFDTGFVSYYRGWQTLRKEDLGYLWEHFVLNEMQARLSNRNIFYWRDKRGHEIDFVLTRPGNQPIAVECKWQADDFNPANLLAFRKQHEIGENFVVCPHITRNTKRRYDNIDVNVVDLEHLIRKMTSKP